MQNPFGHSFDPLDRVDRNALEDNSTAVKRSDDEGLEFDIVDYESDESSS